MTEKKQEKTNVRIYLAGPFFSESQIKRAIRVEKALEANPFIDAYFSPRKNQREDLPFGSKEWRETVFAQDIKQLEWATVVVAIADMDLVLKNDFFDKKESSLLPRIGRELADTDSGTAFEIGYAYAKEIPIVLVHETDRPLNLMLSDSSHAYFNDVSELERYNFLEMPKNRYDGKVI
ncbi:nucleoside 2-deoxyribosyltransferase [Carnobacterium sp. TMP28]|uniref:nucleoside 2-deoxyribosyltransferase n=1 Tax=Carnobacterium sp. TMP28 TaxID=3397060 RepID=UPI0039E19B1F